MRIRIDFVNAARRRLNEIVIKNVFEKNDLPACVGPAIRMVDGW